VSDEEEQADGVPLITMPMLMMALRDSKRSVDPENYQRYLDMREKFEQTNKVVEDAVSGVNAGSVRASESVPFASAPAAQPSLDDDDDDEDIYG